MYTGDTSVYMGVHTGIHQYTSVQRYTQVYLPPYTGICLCVPVYWCIHLYTPVYWCIPLYVYVACCMHNSVCYCNNVIIYTSYTLCVRYTDKVPKKHSPKPCHAKYGCPEIRNYTQSGHNVLITKITSSYICSYSY